MKKTTRRPSKPSPKKRSRGKSARSSARRHVPTQGLYGWITHTDLASADPGATKAWCAEVLGWADEMMAPERVMENVTVAIVRAPGGVPIGFSGP